MPAQVPTQVPEPLASFLTDLQSAEEVRALGLFLEQNPKAVLLMLKLINSQAT